MEKRHTISVLVENEFGVLARIAGLFAQKGYNIESLSVSPTTDATLSRMTIVTVGNDHVVQQIIKQLDKLINVLRVEDLSHEKHVTRELFLVKLEGRSRSRSEAEKLALEMGGKLIDYSAAAFVVEVTGNEAEGISCLEKLKKQGILEVVRTGVIAVQRGEHVLVSPKEKL